MLGTASNIPLDACAGLCWPEFDVPCEGCGVICCTRWLSEVIATLGAR
jgi:hypothetical protein